MSQALDEAYAALGLQRVDGLLWGDIYAAYRRRVMATHPDRGGSAEQFQQVQAAYETLLAWNQNDLDDHQEACQGSPSGPVIPQPRRWGLFRRRERGPVYEPRHVLDESPRRAAP